LKKVLPIKLPFITRKKVNGFFKSSSFYKYSQYSSGCIYLKIKLVQILVSSVKYL